MITKVYYLYYSLGRFGEIPEEISSSLKDYYNSGIQEKKVGNDWNYKLDRIYEILGVGYHKDQNVVEFVVVGLTEKSVITCLFNDVIPDFQKVIDYIDENNHPHKKSIEEMLESFPRSFDKYVREIDITDYIPEKERSSVDNLEKVLIDLDRLLIIKERFPEGTYLTLDKDILFFDTKNGYFMKTLEVGEFCTNRPDYSKFWGSVEDYHAYSADILEYYEFSKLLQTDIETIR